MKISNLKTLLLLSFTVSIPTWSIAAGKTTSGPTHWMFENILFLIAGGIILSAFVILSHLMDSIFIAKDREFLEANGMESTPSQKLNSPSLFQKIYKKAVGLAPMEKEADLLLDHDYDGIKELDNSLPPWWLYGFYLTIIISFAYVYVYLISDIGLSQKEEYKIDMERGEEQKAIFASKQTYRIDEENLIALTDEADLSVGLRAYSMNCIACHGQEGQGGVGPNLTDKYWLHGGSTPQIYNSIKNGIPEKGMIAWKAQMKPSTMHKLASYIKSLGGTNPPNAKAKQGILYTEAQDSSVTIPNN